MQNHRLQYAIAIPVDHQPVTLRLAGHHEDPGKRRDTRQDEPAGEPMISGVFVREFPNDGIANLHGACLRLLNRETGFREYQLDLGSRDIRES